METKKLRIASVTIGIFLFMSGLNPILFYLPNLLAIEIEVTIILLIYLFIAISGLILIIKKTTSFKLPIYATSFTLLSFDTQLISYKLGGLIDLFFFFRSDEGFGISSQLGTRFALSFSNTLDSYMFGLNLISIIILIILLKFDNKKNGEN